MEVRGSRQNEGCKSDFEGSRRSSEGSQRRSLSSSCMVFLMRRSMVVSHWSNREMVSYSFTWHRSSKFYKNNNWVVQFDVFICSFNTQYNIKYIAHCNIREFWGSSNLSGFCFLLLASQIALNTNFNYRDLFCWKKTVHSPNQYRHQHSVLHRHLEVSD